MDEYINKKIEFDIGNSFMADELKIGDMEQAIAAMRSQMNTASSAEESELAFQSILVLQSELNTLRKHHVKNN